MTIAINAGAVSAFEAKIGAWIKAEWAKIEPVAEKFEQAMINDVEVGLEAVAEIAGAAVLKQAPLLISGKEKLSDAADDIVQTVEAGGKTIAQQTAVTAAQQAFDAISNAVTAAKTPSAQ